MTLLRRFGLWKRTKPTEQHLQMEPCPPDGYVWIQPWPLPIRRFVYVCESTCHSSYLHPVEYLLVSGHVLQQEPLQLLAKLGRRQDPFWLNSLEARAVRQDELQFLFGLRKWLGALRNGWWDEEKGGCVHRYMLIWPRGFITNLLWDKRLDVLSLWQEVNPVEARFPPQRTYSPMAL